VHGETNGRWQEVTLGEVTSILTTPDLRHDSRERVHAYSTTRKGSHHPVVLETGAHSTYGKPYLGVVLCHFMVRERIGISTHTTVALHFFSTSALWTRPSGESDVFVHAPVAGVRQASRVIIAVFVPNRRYRGGTTQYWGTIQIGGTHRIEGHSRKY